MWLGIVLLGILLLVWGLLELTAQALPSQNVLFGIAAIIIGIVLIGEGGGWMPWRRG